MIVMKFGGTSVGSATMIEQLVGIVKENLDRKPVVVVSAISKVTDMLLNAAKLAEKGEHKSSLDELGKKHLTVIAELGLERALVNRELEELDSALSKISSAGKATTKELDLAASFGERMSAKIVAACMRKNGLHAQSHNAYDVGMITDSNFGSAEILNETYDKIAESIEKLPEHEVPVITGFIAKTRNGEITTLGRGGSDYTAAIIGTAINAEEVQIWTDANGIMTADPRVVNCAMTIGTVSFSEASELAYFGAKVLHPKTILPVMKRDIPVKVLNTFNPHGKGTTILMHTENENFAGGGITSIAFKKNLSVININSLRMLMMHGFLHRLFRIFDEHEIAVDMISTSEVNVSVTIDSKTHGDISGLIRDIKQIADVEIEDGKASLYIVGRAIKRTPGISAKVFKTLGDTGINVEMISQGASEINVGLVVNEKDTDNAVRALHKAFFAC